MPALRQKIQGVSPDGDRLWLRLMEAGARVGCHQLPERSFFFRGYQFPVCARCTGVAAGSLLALGLLFLRPPLWLCLAACGLMLLDWGLQALRILPSTNFRRLITGLAGGYGVMSLQILALIWVIRWFTR